MQFTERGFMKYEAETGGASGRTDLLIYKNKEAILVDWKYSKESIGKLK